MTTLCQVLGVSPSGYYAWRHRPPSKREMADTILTERIRQIHTWSRQTYGRPRIHAELADEGTRISPKRVARLNAWRACEAFVVVAKPARHGAATMAPSSRIS